MDFEDLVKKKKVKYLANIFYDYMVKWQYFEHTGLNITLKSISPGHFPDGPVVKTLSFQCRRVSSVPGWETGALCAGQRRRKIKAK